MGSPPMPHGFPALPVPRRRSRTLRFLRQLHWPMLLLAGSEGPSVGLSAPTGSWGAGGGGEKVGISSCLFGGGSPPSASGRGRRPGMR